LQLSVSLGPWLSGKEERDIKNKKRKGGCGKDQEHEERRKGGLRGKKKEEGRREGE